MPGKRHVILRVEALYAQAARGGPRGRRAARKLASFCAGLDARRGSMCPSRKLTYARWWALGIDVQTGRPHQTHCDRRYRTWWSKWIGRTSRSGRRIVRRAGEVHMRIHVDASPARHDLGTLRDLLQAQQASAAHLDTSPCP